MSQTLITKPHYSAMRKITGHLFIYSVPGATRRNWNEKSKSSNNVTKAKRCGNALPHQKEGWERCSHAFPPHYTPGEGQFGWRFVPLPHTYKRLKRP